MLSRCPKQTGLGRIPNAAASIFLKFRRNVHTAAVGIDLGTTNSCVAYMDGTQPKVIVNEDGFRTTPSIVSFDENERHVGITAKQQAILNPDNTVFAAKRLMGRRFADQSVKTNIQSLPYNVVEGPNGDAWIKVRNKMYSPSQIGAAVLEKMKSSAETHLNTTVSEAVITVPAYFDDSQRQATKDAGKIAGLEVLRIINEPTAAALAYGADKDASNGKTIAVYDLGGGTFDISILELNDGVFEVKATAGNTNLGGEDFDNRVVQYLVREFKKQSGIDVSKEVIALQRLKEAAESAKIRLSSAHSAQINLPFLSSDKNGPKHFVHELTRGKFEELCSDLLKLTVGPSEQCIRDADLKGRMVDEVILVGGMTRMPKVSEIVKKIFDRDANKSVNPDEAVALGAALQAGVLKGDVKDLLLLDVIPISLGIETLGGVFTRLIERNMTIPTKKSQVFSTAADNQSQVEIRVYQGEREMAADNKLLGQFNLVGLPPAPRGVPQIDVSFDIDANGILNVSAFDRQTNKKQEMTIHSSGGSSKEEIDQMVKEAEEFRHTDKLKREEVDLTHEARAMISVTNKQISDFGTKITSTEKEKLETCITAVENVLGSTDKSDIKRRIADIKASLQMLQETGWAVSRRVYSDKTHETTATKSDNQQEESQPST